MFYMKESQPQKRRHLYFCEKVIIVFSSSSTFICISISIFIFYFYLFLFFLYLLFFMFCICNFFPISCAFTCIFLLITNIIFSL
ncbi:uncharacterized protein DS421_13g401650 [Arachis hypogaea]|nr:uncharacterized protein DS421_13g401650 [Arachis hypogaea]